MVPQEPSRIVSLVPSITETLFELDLEDAVAGITDYCVHPEEKVKNVKRTGGTKNPDVAKIKEIKPDLIIADKHENTRRRIERLMEIAPVFVTEVNNFDDALKMIELLGKLTGKTQEAKEMNTKIRKGFSRLPKPETSKTVFFPVWKSPWITVNKDTFIHSLLERLGLENIFAAEPKPYPQIDEERIRNAHPDFVFLPSEPCTFTPEDVQEIRELFPHSRILTVDGQYFAWYGARLIPASAYFRQLLTDIY